MDQTQRSRRESPDARRSALRARKAEELRRLQHLLAVAVLALGVLVMHSTGVHEVPAPASVAVEHAAGGSAHVPAAPGNTGCVGCPDQLGVATACAVVVLLVVVMVVGAPAQRTLAWNGRSRAWLGAARPIATSRHWSIRELCISRT